MALLWSDYRTHLRRSVLEDLDEDKWDDDQIADFAGWALDTFCAHTAFVSSVEIAKVDDQTVYPLPNNLFESPEIAGSVYSDNENQRLYYKPIFWSPVADPQYSFWVLGDGIHFEQELEYNVTVLYYAYYNHPLVDSSVIDAPQWAIPAISQLVGAFAMTPESIPIATIRSFVDQQDRGEPEQNPYLREQIQFLRNYDNLINRFKPQSRANFSGY